MSTRMTAKILSSRSSSRRGWTAEPLLRPSLGLSGKGTADSERHDESCVLVDER